MCYMRFRSESKLDLMSMSAASYDHAVTFAQEVSLQTLNNFRYSVSVYYRWTTSGEDNNRFLELCLYVSLP